MHGLLGFDLADGSRLDPLGELVDRYQQVGVALERSLQRSDEVQSPYSEGPCDGDGLQSMSREVHLTGVELATLAGSHNLRGIGDGRRPVEALPTRITHEGAWRRMMATYSDVDVSKQLPTLGDGDATLQNPRGAALVELSVDHDERLGSPGDAPRLSVI